MSLEEELRDSLEGLIMSRNLGPTLAGDLASVARAVLIRHGLSRSQVRVRQRGGGFEVDVVIPPGPRRVREVVLHIGLSS